MGASPFAPEVNPASIQTGVSFRDRFDLDSVDFLTFMVAPHERLGVDVSEADYGTLTTLEEASACLEAALPSRAGENAERIPVQASLNFCYERVR